MVFMFLGVLSTCKCTELLSCLRLLFLCHALGKRGTHYIYHCTSQVNIDASVLPFAKAGAGAPNRDQTMRFMFNFLSRRDNSVMDDYRSTASQRDVCLCNRLGRLGVRRASETGLIKWILTLLIDAEQKLYGKWPTYLETYNRVQTIKGLLHDQPTYAGPTVHTYPESPHELDGRIYKLAYDDGDPPVVRYVNNYEQIGNHVPLRWDNQKLKDELSSMENGGESLTGRYARSRTMSGGRFLQDERSLLQDLRDRLDREEMGFRFTQPQPHGGGNTWGRQWGGGSSHEPSHAVECWRGSSNWQSDHGQSWDEGKPRWGEDMHVHTYMEAFKNDVFM